MQMRLNAAARFRNVGRCESQQLGFGHGMAGGAGDIGHGQLARVRVGMANGGGQCHGRVRLKSVLNHARVDVVATAGNELLLAAGDVEIPVFILPPQVTGVVEPALAVAGIYLNVVVVLGPEVAAEHVFAAHTMVLLSFAAAKR